ncbi:MAG: ribosomal-processing cysteine protease Prp [Oscillospiraceae bacterium]|nr:ribosomal-processing cysteine protease Prp [Oscillospiraceae bacterium]
MTKLKFFAENGRFRIVAEGHATGSPAVCAAISGIMYALAGYLNNVKNTDTSSVTYGDTFPSRGRIRGESDDVRLELREGYAEIEFSGGEDAKAVYLMAVIGLLQIAKAEPDYVEIEKDVKIYKNLSETLTQLKI